MNAQTIIIVLLALIVLKLYPSLGETVDTVSSVVLAVVVIGLIVLSFWFLVGLAGDWISNKEKRKKRKAELSDITKTLKQIDEINKRVK
ncbi:hypothetical protein HEF39_003714 [Escherichia coli]|nr:hypothetical protein [Escherichia coli]